MVVFQFANDIRADKKVCYTLSRCPHRLAAKDATLSRWISRVRIPLGAPCETKSPLPFTVTGFFTAECRDSNPTGCGAEETRSVFQRSTQGAERRSGSGRRQPHADIPLGAPQHLRSPLPSVTGFFTAICRDSNPAGCGSCSPPKASGQKMANMSTVTILVTAISRLQKVI